MCRMAVDQGTSAPALNCIDDGVFLRGTSVLMAATLDRIVSTASGGIECCPPTTPWDAPQSIGSNILAVFVNVATLSRRRRCDIWCSGTVDVCIENECWWCGMKGLLDIAMPPSEDILPLLFLMLLL